MSQNQTSFSLAVCSWDKPVFLACTHAAPPKGNVLTLCGLVFYSLRDVFMLLGGLSSATFTSVLNLREHQNH